MPTSHCIILQDFTVSKNVCRLRTKVACDSFNWDIFLGRTLTPYQVTTCLRRSRVRGLPSHSEPSHGFLILCIHSYENVGYFLPPILPRGYILFSLIFYRQRGVLVFLFIFCGHEGRAFAQHHSVQGVMGWKRLGSTDRCTQANWTWRVLVISIWMVLQAVLHYHFTFSRTLSFQQSLYSPHNTMSNAWKKSVSFCSSTFLW